MAPTLVGRWFCTCLYCSFECLLTTRTIPFGKFDPSGTTLLSCKFECLLTTWIIPFGHHKHCQVDSHKSCKNRPAAGFTWGQCSSSFPSGGHFRSGPYLLDSSTWNAPQRMKKPGRPACFYGAMWPCQYLRVHLRPGQPTSGISSLNSAAQPQRQVLKSAGVVSCSWWCDNNWWL